MSPGFRYLSTTMALVAIGLGYALFQAKPWRPAPRLEARSVALRPPVPPPAPPTAREILERGAALSLTADQKTRLAALDRRWSEEVAPLEAAVQEAEEEFSRFMKESQAGGRASLQEIQDHSADVRELGAALRGRRLLHAEAAVQILTEQQRKIFTPSRSPEITGGSR
jgi:hypothetical protein